MKRLIPLVAIGAMLAALPASASAKGIKRTAYAQAG
jgi:hypothetical protein